MPVDEQRIIWLVGTTYSQCLSERRPADEEVVQRHGLAMAWLTERYNAAAVAYLDGISPHHIIHWRDHYGSEDDVVYDLRIHCIRAQEQYVDEPLNALEAAA